MERAFVSPAGAERRSPTPAAVHKREAIRRLKDAMQEDRFVLHYQPIVGARDGRVASAEALLRWRTPDREQDSITELIGSVERSPVIFKLENWTLAQALRAARVWRDAGLGGLRVAVNLSAREFPRANVVRRVQQQLAAARLPPTALALEITESSRMEDFGAAADRLEELAALGIELWLDDFGTGHSSLEWLSLLPTHGLKIPGTFVERLLADRRCHVIVRRAIEMAHDLGLRVVAEGVETAEQRDRLAADGCDLFQGFLFFPPMPAEELPGALAAAGAGPAGRSAS
ncbi:MAG TPA: EAL domain-containing protein [Vicinamibacteria bacterium]|nr:EAL domain-containing protein [Vicinamibacteria bacterium]